MEGWQGVSESAVSAKRGWVLFGAKPAHSETPVPVAQLSGVHPEGTQWGKDARPPKSPYLRLVPSHRLKARHCIGGTGVGVTCRQYRSHWVLRQRFRGKRPTRD